MVRQQPKLPLFPLPQAEEIPEPALKQPIPLHGEGLVQGGKRRERQRADPEGQPLLGRQFQMQHLPQRPAKQLARGPFLNRTHRGLQPALISLPYIKLHIITRLHLTAFFAYSFFICSSTKWIFSLSVYFSITESFISSLRMVLAWISLHA